MKEKIVKLRKDILIMELNELKVNYKELAEKHKVDYRTVKKYVNGYEGKSNVRNKKSSLNQYIDEIKLKFEYTKKISSVYRYFNAKYGDIGSYHNFRYFVIKNNLNIYKNKAVANPRYETDFGEQLQFDWKEDLCLYNKHGELFEFNIFSATLSASRYHKFIYSRYKTKEDVINSLIEVFKSIGGIPKQLLTDNMSSIVNTKTKTFFNEFIQFCNDMGTKPKNCKIKKPETKGKVESSNRFMDWLKPYNGEFETEEELIAIIKSIEKQANIKPNDTTLVSPIMLIKKEITALNNLPNKEILSSYINNLKSVKVPNTFLIYYKGKNYSVSPKYINKIVELKEIDNKLHIYYNSELIIVHNISDKLINYNENHYKEGLQPTFKNNEELEIQVTNNLNLLNKIGVC